MLPATDCPSIDTLERLVAGDVLAVERASLEAHCSSCADCGRRFATISTNLGLQARLRRQFGVNAGSGRPTIDGFVIVREIGRGAMGVVFEALQSSPARRVALKVVRGSNFAGERAFGLFQREIHALARLSHPGIATLYSAGGTANGEPYFAMELVDGLSLGDWVRAHAPSVRARLALVSHLADAVHHAHQRGVVHRDLKPSNVRVGEGDVAKILDFGLAKILDDERASDAARSLPGSVRGTLAYMAPEQARGDPDAVDARSDVYALGVMLYELLASRLPVDVAGKDLLAAARAICETAPEPLRRFERSARGDLEAIAMRALAKEPDERYASAAALADDLQRWLRGDPVLARPQSTAYLIARLVRRHRLASALAACVLALSLGSAVWMSVLYRRADRLRSAAQEAEAVATAERDLARRHAARAENEREDSEWSLRFYARMFDEASQSFEPANLRVAELLDTLARELDRPSDRPLMSAAAVGVHVASLERALGRLDRAEERLRWSIDAIERAGFAESSDAATAHAHLAGVLLSSRRLDDAQAELELASGLLSRARESKYDEDVALLIELRRGQLAQSRGRPGEATAILLPALERMRARLQPDEGMIREASSSTVTALNAQGRYAEAEPLAAQAAETELRLCGPDHRLTIKARAALAVTLFGLGQGERALEIASDVHARSKRVAGSESRTTLDHANTVAAILWELGRREEALPLFREISVAQARALGPDHLATLTTRFNLAHGLFGTGATAEAAEIFADVLERASSALGALHPLTLKARVGVARGHIAAARYEEAEAALCAVWDRYAAEPSPKPADVRLAATVLAALYEAWQRESVAGIWRERAAAFGQAR